MTMRNNVMGGQYGGGQQSFGSTGDLRSPGNLDAHGGGSDGWYNESQQGASSSGNGGASAYASHPASQPTHSPNSVWNGGSTGHNSLHQRSNSVSNGNTQSTYGGSGPAYGGSYYNQGGAQATNYGAQQQYGGGDMDTMNSKYGGKSIHGDEDYDNEPPLLEELGINLQFVWLKFLIVMFPQKDLQTLNHLSKLSFSSFSKLVMKGTGKEGYGSSLGGSMTSNPTAFPHDFESDMTGPVLAFLILAIFMLLAGKVNFGYVYGFSVCGCSLLHGVLELMYASSPSQPQQQQQQQQPQQQQNWNIDNGNPPLSYWETVSTLGYSLIPVVLLSFINVFIRCNGLFGLVLSVGACSWATYAATRLLDARMNLYKQNQFVLVAYPVALFYAVFCLITIF